MTGIEQMSFEILQIAARARIAWCQTWVTTCRKRRRKRSPKLCGNSYRAPDQWATAAPLCIQMTFYETCEFS
jgi:hypothetical protein